MNEASTSLDLLHDLALPSEVSWWPWAPGWYVILGICVFLVFMFVRRIVKRWQANAYRREALRELASAPDAAAIAELLRRTALAIAPRPVIAEKTGSAWLDWLDQRCSEPLSDAMREKLTAGVYGHAATRCEVAALRDYAAHWIRHHDEV